MNIFENRPNGLRYWDANEIIDGLLLGSVTAIQRQEAMEYFKINAVVSILSEPQMKIHENLENHLKSNDISFENGNWLRFEFADARLKGNIQKYLHLSADFINKYMIENKSKNDNNNYVMVHCFAGASRSPTIISAYLIKYKNMTLEQSLNLLANKRNVAHPNTYFQEQLALFQKGLNSNCNSCVLL